MSTVLYILVALLVFGVLIAVHELGHFLAAKAYFTSLPLNPHCLNFKAKRGISQTSR